MAQVEVEPEDVFEASKSQAVNRARGVLSEYFGGADKQDFADDLMDALDLERIPKSFDVEIVLHLGKQAISISGFEVEEEDEDE